MERMSINIIDESEVANRKSYRHTSNFIGKLLKTRKIKDNRAKISANKIVTINSLTIITDTTDDDIINI